ncbi:hypothetical protein ACM66B_004233 [Microbotryomycetes sp. NB124-2]
MPSIVQLVAAALGASAVLAHGSGSDQHHHLAVRAAAGDLHPNHTKRAIHDRRMVRKSIKRGTLSKRGETVYTTQAQYYAKTGGYSACHTYFDDNSLVFSLPTGLWPEVYNPSPLCGKKVVATNPATGQSLTLTVQDASWFAGSVQVPVGVFKQLGGSTEQGVLPIEFHFVDEDLNLPESTSGATDIFGAASSDVRAAASSSAASVATVKPQNNVVKTTTAAPITTAAPTTTTEAPVTTTTVDQASIASVKLAAEQAAASSSSAAAQAAASAAAQAEADKKAQEEADKKAAEEAAAAAASSSSAAAAAAAATTTTTTEAAPEPTSNGGSQGNNDGGNSESGNNDGGNVISGGYATYFYQNGVAGNCGTVGTDDQKLIALPTAIYDGGRRCGRQIKITRVSNGATVVATVRDSCPTCVNNESLDLSVGAFTAIATESEGMVPITWEYI